jgi:ceramide glucosyltransferase
LINIGFLAVKAVLIGCTLAADAFYILSMIAGLRFFSRRETDAEYLPPVSIMVPLYGADFNAWQNYARCAGLDYPSTSLVFGVREAGDSSIPIIERLKAGFPDADINGIVSAETIGQNLKVSNLQNMYRGSSTSTS